MVDEPHRAIPKPDLRTPKALTDRAKEAHKREVKSAFRNIQAVENEIAQLSESAKLLSLIGHNGDFGDNDLPSNLRNRDVASYAHSSTRQNRRHGGISDANEVDLSTKKDMWEQKIQLHIRLADRYLDLIRLDYAFSEKKNLESLCWKRAIYSLVEQFRQALKICAKLGRSPKEEDVGASVLIEVDSDDDVSTAPESSRARNGVSKDGQSAREEYTLVKLLFNNFLIQADDFYERLMLTVYELENKSNRTTDAASPAWSGHKRQKWFKSVPNRGDLARYRWSFTTDSNADREIADKFNIVDYVPINREDARRIAWKWYTLGSWLMPNAGKPYFNLALLMHGQGSMEACHKLYLNMCSLIVRRNAFLNGREGILFLLEENRGWVAEYTKSILSTATRRHNLRREIQANQSRQRTDADTRSAGPPDNKSTSDLIIISLFIRLHGMMFTKIGLDQFKEIRRRYFESLFPNSLLQHSGLPTQSTERKGLSGTEQFWMETAVTNLASVYHYNYSTSRVAKLTFEVFKKLYEVVPRKSNEDESPKSSEEGSVSEHTDMKRSSSMSESPDAMIQFLKEDEIFSHGISLSIQIAVEMLSRFNANDKMNIATPLLPPFPVTVVSFASPDKKPWAIDAVTADRESGHHEQAWLVYIHVLLQWLALSCMVCRGDSPSYWENMVGPICGTYKSSVRQGTFGVKQDESKVSTAFWTLLVEFFSKLLRDIPSDIKYKLIDTFIFRAAADFNEDDKVSRNIYLLQCAMTLPMLPEEATLKGLGWVEEAVIRLNKTTPAMQGVQDFDNLMTESIELQRKIRIISYAFVLHQQMSDLLSFDTVEEVFSILEISRPVDEMERVISRTNDIALESSQRLEEQDNEHPSSGLALDADAEDDAEDDAEENSIIQQLKARRKQLEQDLLKAKPPSAHQKIRKARKDEKLERMNELREQVVSGTTPLVVDTNCFIGDLANVKTIIQCAKWQIIIPLVVITELDGLRTNQSALGTAAQDALAYLEQIFSQNKSQATRLAHVRIQTSHNNFLHDISMRSEQFMWGETDRNLDDLILSACLWWDGQPSTEVKSYVCKVCLVTSDRNLSVKARARDIRVADLQSLSKIAKE